jgi:hypothetical protein
MSTSTQDLKLARKFHKSKLEELVLDKHGKGEFLVPAHQRLLCGALLDELATALTEVARVRPSLT